MNSSNRNPATEVFDRVQKWAVPLIIIVAAGLAILRNDLSVAFFPLALFVAAVYLAIILVGSRIIRAIGAKLLQRR